MKNWLISLFLCGSVTLAVVIAMRAPFTSTAAHPANQTARAVIDGKSPDSSAETLPESSGRVAQSERALTRPDASSSHTIRDASNVLTLLESDMKAILTLESQLGQGATLFEADHRLRMMAERCGRNTQPSVSLVIEKMIASAVRLYAASDTPEVRTSILFSNGVREEFCRQFGKQRAAALAKTMFEKSKAGLYDDLWSDMVYGINPNPGKPREAQKLNFPAALQIVYAHESPRAVSFALSAIAESHRDNHKLEDSLFFNAGKGVGSINERVKLVHWVGTLHHCKVSPADCLPNSFYTLSICDFRYICAPDRDLRAIAALLHSTVEMQAIEAMTEVLHQERLQLRSKLRR